MKLEELNTIGELPQFIERKYTRQTSKR